MVIVDKHARVPDTESDSNEHTESDSKAEEESSTEEDESSEEGEEVDSSPNKGVAVEKPPHAVAIKKKNLDLELKKPPIESQNNKAGSVSQSESRSQGAAVNKPLDLNQKKSTSGNQINISSSSEEAREEDCSEEEEEGDISPQNKAVAEEKPPHAVDMRRENLVLNLKNKAGSGSHPESRSQINPVNKPNAVDTNSLEEENIGLNPSESQNKAGSTSQAAAEKLETERTDLKLDLPAKRAVEDMGQHDCSPRKRIKNMVSGRDVASLLRNETGVYCFGLEEETVSQVWAMEVDKEENRELVERIKNLKDAHWTLKLQDAQLRADVTKFIVDALRKNQ